MTLFSDDALTGTLRAAQLLSRTYTFVATNVPFLSRGNHSEVLRTFGDRVHPEAKNDLATMFFQRIIALLEPGGALAGVSPYNWYFLGSYKNLRRTLLDTVSLQLVSNLGFKSFRTPMWDFNIGFTILTNTPPALDHAFAGIDGSAAPTPAAKADLLRSGGLALVSQAAQHQNPKSTISLVELNNERLLSEYVDVYYGTKPGQTARVVQYFWEQAILDPHLWRLMESTPQGLRDFDGKSKICYSEDQIRKHEIVEYGWNASTVHGSRGVILSQMNRLPCSLYSGNLFDNNTSLIRAKNGRYLPAVFAFMRSPLYLTEVRARNAKLDVDTQSMISVPFDLDHWQAVANERYPDGPPEPYSSDPTQWLFDGTVPGSDHPLQVAVARLLGYAWPEQAEDGLGSLADPDGIVCLPSVNREPQAPIRLRALLERAYADTWSDAVLAGVLREAGAPSLDAWLRAKRGFFEQHTKLFHHRPFIWHLTDGHREGFSALVNYHRLTTQTLSKLIYTYLNDWIDRQRRAVAANEPGAQGRLEAATKLRAKLIAIAEGEPPYDIYVRWKSLAEQPIGWQPDLNDGVRMNIRPFVEAGVLAAKVNVKWGKDRGADPAIRDEPLLAEAATRDLRDRIARHASTDRHNDLHFSNDEKRRARELANAPRDP